MTICRRAPPRFEDGETPDGHASASGRVMANRRQSLPAALARRLGAFLITQTMEALPDIGFKSYDRLFPSQDTMPAGACAKKIQA